MTLFHDKGDGIEPYDEDGNLFLGVYLDREPTEEEAELIQAAGELFFVLVPQFTGMMGEVVLAGGIDQYVAQVGDITGTSKVKEFAEFLSDPMVLESFLIVEHVLTGTLKYIRWSMENELNIDMPPQKGYTAVKVSRDERT